MPEIEIRIKVYLCSRCGHLWEKRKREDKVVPITCPNCSSPYWDIKPKDWKKKKLLPLRFHGEGVLDSNFNEVYSKAHATT